MFLIRKLHASITIGADESFSTVYTKKIKDFSRMQKIRELLNMNVRGRNRILNLGTLMEFQSYFKRIVQCRAKTMTCLLNLTKVKQCKMILIYHNMSIKIAL